MSEKTVLVTGCSSGIGRATAREFLDEGWQVYATARNPADIQTLGEAGCELATLDVTDDGDVERVVERIADEAGRIDCLVNNAGYAQFGPLEDLPVGAVRHQYDVNVLGPHRLTRAVLPHMRAQGDGTVVTLSSAAGLISFPGGSAYSGSKHAVEAMHDALRNEVDDHGIDVVLVEPGPVETNFDERASAEMAGEGDSPGVEKSGAYGWFYEAYRDTKALGGGGPAAVPPGRVAAEIVNVASATRPPARVPVGPVAHAVPYATLLPDWLLDRLFGLVKRHLA